MILEIVRDRTRREVVREVVRVVASDSEELLVLEVLGEEAREKARSRAWVGRRGMRGVEKRAVLRVSRRVVRVRV